MHSSSSSECSDIFARIFRFQICINFLLFLVVGFLKTLCFCILKCYVFFIFHSSIVIYPILRCCYMNFIPRQLSCSHGNLCHIIYSLILFIYVYAHIQRHVCVTEHVIYQCVES
jgi:hypothetical protein